VGITCFVAMAIGRSDINRLYERQIKPMLQEFGIRPVFMGRLEHNDNLDQRIIREIEACNFAIADLTYARPSIYFEAGFAERKVPVVYTCRQDHLRPRAGDDFGNYKVHFDLQMRNIVHWSRPEDSTFVGRLKKRIAVVIRPALRDKESESQAADEEREFGSLALNSRLALVHDIFKRALQRVGWRGIVQSDGQRPWAGQLAEPRTLSLAILWVQVRFTQREIRERVEATDRLLRSRFVYGNDPFLRWELRNFRKPTSAELKGVKNLRARIVFCSLERIPSQRLAAALPSYAASHDLKAYEWDGPFPVPIRSTTEFGNRYLPLTVSVLPYDDIRSERSVREKARSLSVSRRLRQTQGSRRRTARA
jgi:hypothetical protein